MMIDNSTTPSRAAPRLAADREPPSVIDAGRSVAVIAVHHIRANGYTYTGGAEKYICQAVGSLLDAGVRVHVGYSGTSIYEDLLLRAHPTQLTVERTGWLNDVLSGDARLELKTVRLRRRWLRAIGADTLFAVQQAGGGSFGASLIAARSLGMRVVSSIRQSPTPLPPSTHKRWFGCVPSPELWRRRLLWRRRVPAWCCDAIIFNSHRVADAHCMTYGLPRHRTRIIYNGETVRDPDEHARGKPSHIASIGRVTKAKGADVLLDAFAKVADEHPDSHLTYYGDGPLIPELSARADRLGLSDRVSFPGYRPDHDEIFPNIDVCVQPSRRESMSNSVVEALARGIPCVVTDVGGLPETVADGETGFVVPVNRPDRCAAAICRLLKDRETFARFSRAAGQRARKHFDIHHLMRETVDTILGTEPGAIV